MDILVHDYAGHPFQVELSRELALRGRRVTHAYFSGDCGPKGPLAKSDADPEGLEFVAIDTGRPYSKSAFVSRHFADASYGDAISKFIRSRAFDVVISGNTPTRAQAEVAAACKKNNIRFVYWMQDFYSVAVDRILRQKFGVAGRAVGAYYQYLERRQLRDADAIVIIAEDFRPLIRRWGVDDRKIFTIENWGSLDGVKLADKRNEWTERNGLADTFNFLYSGTLGLKHNPDFLIELARKCAGQANIVVVAQGVGVAALVSAKEKWRLDNLIVLPLQPFEQLSNVLAGADVAIAVIEASAGVFSVPSKVQSYLCAGRPILLAAPPENLAAQVVRKAKAGVVVSPEDRDSFVNAALHLLRDDALRDDASKNGREYALRTYRIERVADRFEAVLGFAAQHPHGGYAGDPRAAWI
jgi:glycosyltransferase involved in cell wall biosynthesis